MSGLNGLESWNLNIQSVCAVLYWSGAARCEACVDARHDKVFTVCDRHAASMESASIGVSFTEIESIFVEILEDRTSHKCKMKLNHHSLDPRSPYFESFTELDKRYKTTGEKVTKC